MRVVRRPALAASLGLVCFLGAAAQGCTDGTTPDCSDAQCVVVSVVEAGSDAAEGDAGDDGGEDAGAVTDAGDAGAETADARADGGPSSEAGVVDGGGDGGDGGDAH